MSVFADAYDRGNRKYIRTRANESLELGSRADVNYVIQHPILDQDREDRGNNGSKKLYGENETGRNFHVMAILRSPAKATACKQVTVPRVLKTIFAMGRPEKI